MGERDKGKGKQKEEEDFVALQMKEDEITGLAYFLEDEDGEVSAGRINRERERERVAEITMHDE